MSYVGNIPTTAAFPFDQFSGNGSTTAFTLSYAPAGTTSIIVSISGVVQNPNTYSVSGTTLTFAPAPPTGTNNIAVLYLGLPVVATLTPGNTAYFTRSVFTATASQTVFTPSGTYQVGFVNVIRNGATLAPADYTATNGTTVTLLNPCAAGDTVVIEVYNLVSIANALPATGGTVTGATTYNSTVSINGANVSGFTGFKNRIINGGMVIDQRNAGAAVTLSGSSSWAVDRFLAFRVGSSVATGQRSTVAPAGFTNSFLYSVTTGAAVSAGDYSQITQLIEGFNTADLGWGTANAQTVTVSFWVRSSVTGTFGVSLANSATNRSYVTSFVVNAANTWEQKTITIPGDTSGTWLTDNGVGIRLAWDMGFGSSFNTSTTNSWQASSAQGLTGGVKLTQTTGATFYITGVQLERGSNATSFEFRSIGQELALCQRYYYKTQATGASMFFMAQCGTTTTSIGLLNFPVSMRTAPTALEQSGTAGHYQVAHSNADTVCSSVPTFFSADTWGATSIFTVASGLTVGRGSINRAVNSSAYLGWSAEL